MSENDNPGYQESPDTADADSNLISGRTGDRPRLVVGFAAGGIPARPRRL